MSCESPMLRTIPLESILSSKLDRIKSSREDHESSIILADNRLLILNWETDDADIVSFFENKTAADRPRALNSALKVGVVASSVAGTTERIDYIQKEFASLQTKFNALLDKTLLQLGERFDDVFGEKGKFAEVVQNTFGANGQVAKEIFNPAKEGSPLYELRTELGRQITDLRNQMLTDKTREQVERSTPKGGFRFEDEIEAVLAEIVRQRKGDQLQRVTNVSGRMSRSKKGDFILQIAEKPDAPIVIETKSLESASLPAIKRTLQEALENRGATYSILVAEDVEALPQSVGWFNEYEGDKLVCAVGDSESQQLRLELLTIAVSWARLRVLQRVEKASVDSTIIQDAVVKVQTDIGRLNDILTQCKNLENATDRIRDICRDIVRDVTQQLNIVSSAVKN